jgi:hypothetical protein
MTSTHNPSTLCRAGVGKVEITFEGKGAWKDLLSEQVKRHIPPDYLSMEVEVSDPLYVRALALDNGVEKVVFITMDVTAIGARTISQNILSDSADDFVSTLRQRVSDELDIRDSCLVVCASHAHQTPRMLCDDEAQIERTLKAVRQSLDSMEPVTISVGSAHEVSLTVNRTMKMKDGTDYTIRSYYSTMPDDEDIEAMRSVDPEIGILRIDRLNGRPLAVLYNFACHLLLGAPNGCSGTITADHVGVALKYIEDRLGGGVMAFSLQGSLGDIIEAGTFDTEHPSTSFEFGVRLGESIVNALPNTKASESTIIATVSKTVELPLRVDIPDRIALLKEAQSETAAALRYTTLNFKAFLPLYLKYSLNCQYPSHWAYRYLHAEQCGNVALKAMDQRNKSAIDIYLESIKKMEKMANRAEDIATLEKHQEVIDGLGTRTVPAEFHGIRIGDCVFITAPMELLAETGLYIKKTSPFKYTYIISLANGYLHYAPPASYYARGGYETTECLLAPEWEQLFANLVEEFFDKLETSK